MPFNRDRAERALQVMEFYDELPGVDPDALLVDLLTDLRHLCAEESDSQFDHAVHVSEIHFNAESES